MKYLRTYYLLDELSETICGSFTAPNERFAVKRVLATIEKSDDLKEIRDSLVLVASNKDFEIAETYDEAYDNDNCFFIDIPKEPDNG